jgi:hypothetical protein
LRAADLLVRVRQPDDARIRPGRRFAVDRVISKYHSRAKKRFDARTRELSQTTTQTQREQRKREIASGKQRLKESLAPNTRFVRIESEREAQVNETLESQRADAPRCSALTAVIRSRKLAPARRRLSHDHARPRSDLFRPHAQCAAPKVERGSHRRSCPFYG